MVEWAPEPETGEQALEMGSAGSADIMYHVDTGRLRKLRVTEHERRLAFSHLARVMQNKRLQESAFLLLD